MKGGGTPRKFIAECERTAPERQKRPKKKPTNANGDSQEAGRPMEAMNSQPRPTSSAEVHLGKNNLTSRHQSARK